MLLTEGEADGDNVNSREGVTDIDGGGDGYDVEDNEPVKDEDSDGIFVEETWLVWLAVDITELLAVIDCVVHAVIEGSWDGLVDGLEETLTTLLAVAVIYELVVPVTNGVGVTDTDALAEEDASLELDSDTVCDWLVVCDWEEYPELVVVTVWLCIAEGLLLTETDVDMVDDFVDVTVFFADAVTVINGVAVLQLVTDTVVVFVTTGVTDCVLLVLWLTDSVELVDEVGLAVTQLDKLAKVVEVIEGLELGDTV